MMLRLIIGIVILSIVYRAPAQTTLEQDARLQAVLAMPGDTAKVDSLIIQIIRFARTKPDQALAVVNPALKLAEGLSHSNSLFRTHRIAALLYRDQGNYDVAIDHAEESLSYLPETGEARKRVAILNTLANLYNFKGFYRVALETYLEALKIVDEIEGSAFTKAAIYNNMAVIFNRESDQRKSREYYLKAMALLEDMDKNPRVENLLANTISNIGLTYNEEKDFEIALNYYERGLEIRKKLNNPRISLLPITISATCIWMQHAMILP